MSFWPWKNAHSFLNFIKAKIVYDADYILNGAVDDEWTYNDR